MNKNIVEFTNRNGKILRGFFYAPKLPLRGFRKDLIVFPNGGLMGCEGDFRAYVRMARFLIDKGFYVFKFSPSGLGLSEGLIDSCKRNDLFTKIETGLFVEDIKSSIDYITSQEKFDSIAITGVCGGAISAFISASQIKEVDFVIPIGMPIILDSDDVDYNERMPKEQAKFILKTYYSKFLSPIAWWRFINGKSDWQTIKMILTKLIVWKKNNVENDIDERGVTPNPEFFKSARKIIGNKKILFIYGDTDWIYWEFEKHFIKKYFSNANNRQFDIYLISNGNHMLTWVEMQDNATKKIYEWLNEKINNC